MAFSRFSKSFGISKGWATAAADVPVPPEPGTPDFTLTATTVTTQWGTVLVGNLVPNEDTPLNATFELLDETAGLAVVSGGL